VNRLLLATRSADKVREIKEILSGTGVEVVSLEEARVPWSSMEDTLEDFDSFQANARSKAEYFAKLTGLPTVADDSGIEVLSLMGVPGVRSKRFAPNAMSLSGKELDAANNRGSAVKKREDTHRMADANLHRPVLGPLARGTEGHGRLRLRSALLR